MLARTAKKLGGKLVEMMKSFHEWVSKKQWFILFNVVAVIALAVTGRLEWSTESLVTSLIALLAVNVVAAISARNFPEWK